MGAFPTENTHVKRSSSMAFALRWNRESLRLISLIALTSFALMFLFFLLLNGTASKSVSLELNGQTTALHTKQAVLQRLLDEKKIALGKHDRVSHDLNGPIRDGDVIRIESTTPVNVVADGRLETLYTTGKTVQQALQDLHIAFGADDRVFPALEDAVAPNAPIKIVRVDKKADEQLVPIAYDTVKKNDDSLPKGNEKTVQPGKEGAKLVKTELVFEDGRLVARNMLGETVQTASVDKVVAVGTKKPVVAVAKAKTAAAAPAASDQITKNGVSFGYKNILKNVTLTAYSAGVESTGKSSAHPQYGVTASGSKVAEGRTIAVDKNVIPLGWWVYIEGIGFRRAEDTGSAVKGNKIDVYYDSTEYADKFGMKRGYTVYVIGPKKPTAE